MEITTYKLSIDGAKIQQYIHSPKAFYNLEKILQMELEW